MKERETKLYRFHWLDGRTSEGHGTTAADAFARLGYGNGALPALDWWEEAGEAGGGEVSA